MALIGKYTLCLGIVTGTAYFNIIEKDEIPSSKVVEKQSIDTESQQQNGVYDSPETCPEKDSDRVVETMGGKLGRAICQDCLELSTAVKNTAPQ